MHGCSIRRLLLAVSIYSTLGQAQATRGCQGTQGSKGFDVNIYSYPLFGFSGLSDSFFTTGYSSGTLQGTVSGVTDINFSGKSDPLFGNGEIYGFSTTVSHFAMKLTGYFLAPQTGDYSFKLEHSDNAASFQIGVKSGLTCYESNTVDSLISDEMIINRDTDWFGGDLTTRLTAGTYYPVRIVYYNSFLSATLQLKVTHPDNFEQTTFDNVYQLKLRQRSSPTIVVSTSPMIKSSITDSVLSSTKIELPTLSSALSQSSSTAISAKSSLAASSSRIESSRVQNSYTVALGGSSTLPNVYTVADMSTQPTSTSSASKSVTEQSTSIDSLNSTYVQSFTLSDSKAVSTKCPCTAGCTLSSKPASSLSWNTTKTQTARQTAVTSSASSTSSRGYSLNDKHSSGSVLTQILTSASQLREYSSRTFGSIEKFSGLPSQSNLSSEVFHSMRSSSLGKVSSLASKSSEPGETPQNSGSSTLFSQVRSLLPESCSHELSLSLRTFTTKVSNIVSGSSESFDRLSSSEKSSSPIGSLYSLKPSVSSSLNSTESLSGENTPWETARASSYSPGSNLSSNGSSHYSVSGVASLSSLTPESRPSSVLLLPTTTSFRPSPRSTVDLVHSSSSVLSLSKTDSLISESNRTHSLESSSNLLSSAFSALTRLNCSKSNYGNSSSLSALASLERVESSNSFESSANSLNSSGSAVYLNSANSLKSHSSDRLSSQSSILVPSNALSSTFNITFVSRLSSNTSSTISLLSSGSLKPYSTSSSFKYVQTVSSLSYLVSPSVSITVGSAEFSSSETRFSSLGPSGSLSFETSSNRSRFINSSSSKPLGSHSLSFAQYSSLSGSLNVLSSVVSQTSKYSSSVPGTSSDLSSSITSSSNRSSGSLYNLSSMVAQLSNSVRSLSSGTSLNLSSSITSSFKKPSGSLSFQSSAISQSGRSLSSSSTSRTFSFETSSNLSNADTLSSNRPSGSLTKLSSASFQYSSPTSSLESFRSFSLGFSSNFSRSTTFSSSRPSSSLKNLSSVISQSSSSSSFETFSNLSSTIIPSSSRLSNSLGTYRSSSLRTSSNFSSLVTGISSKSSGSVHDLSSTASQFSRASRSFTSGTSSRLLSSVSFNSAKPSGSVSSVTSRPRRTSSSLGYDFSNILSFANSNSSRRLGSLSSLSSTVFPSSNSSRSFGTFRSFNLRTTTNLSRSITSSSSSTLDSQNNLSSVALQPSRTSSFLDFSDKSLSRSSSNPSSLITSSSGKLSGSLSNLNSVIHQSGKSSGFKTSSNLSSSITSGSRKLSGSLSEQGSAASQSSMPFTSFGSSRSPSFDTSSKISSSMTSCSSSPSNSSNTWSSAVSRFSETSISSSAGITLILSSSITSRSLGSSISSSLSSSIASNSNRTLGSRNIHSFGGSRFSRFSSLSSETSSNPPSSTTFSSSRPSSSLKNLSSLVSQSRSSSSFETFTNLSSTIIPSLSRPSDSLGTYRLSNSRTSTNFSSFITSRFSISSGPLSKLSFVGSRSSRSSSSFVTSRPLGTGTSSSLPKDITANYSKRPSYLGNLSFAASQFSRASQTFAIKTSSKLSSCTSLNSAKPAGSLDLSSVASRPSRTSSSLGSDTFSSFLSSVSFSSSKPPGSLSILSSAASRSSNPLRSLSSFRSSSFGASSNFSKSIFSRSSRPSGAGNMSSLTVSESSKYSSLGSGNSPSLPNFVTSRASHPNKISSLGTPRSSSSRIFSNVSCSITSKFSRPSGPLTSLSSPLSQASKSFTHSSSGKPNSLISLGSSSSLTTSISITSKRPTQLSASPKTSQFSRSVSDISSHRNNQSFRFSSHSTQIWSSSASSSLELKPDLSSSESLNNLSLNSRLEHPSSASGTLQPYFSTISSELTFSGSSNWGHITFSVHSQSYQSSKPDSRSLLAYSLSASLPAITGPSMREFPTMPHMPRSSTTKAVIQLSDSSKKFTASTKTFFRSSTVDSLDAFSTPGVQSFSLATRSGTGLGVLSSNSEILRHSDLNSSSLRTQESHPYPSANIKSPASTSYRASSTGPLTHFPLKSLLSFSKRLDLSPSQNVTPTGLSKSQIPGSRFAVGKQPQNSLRVQPTSSPITSLSALSTTFTTPGNSRESSPKGTLPTYYSNFSSLSISTIRSWRVSLISPYTINTGSSQKLSTSIGLSGLSIDHQSAITESAASVSTIKSNFVSSTICVVESSALSEGSRSVTKLSTVFPTESLRTTLMAPPERLTVTLRGGSTEGHSSETFQEFASLVQNSSAAQFSAASVLTPMMTSAQIVTSVASPRLSILPSTTLSNSEYAGATIVASGPPVVVEYTSKIATDSRGLPENISSALNYESLRQSKGVTTSLDYVTGWATSTISTSKSGIGELHTRHPVGITDEAVRLETDLGLFFVCVALYFVL